MDWFPWYHTKYKQDTMHLDPYQDGCYRRLIDHYMQTEAPLPDNDAALARIVGDSLEKWLAYGQAIVRPFFIAKNGLLFHKKCQEILDDQNARKKNNVENGKNGAYKRWNKINKIDTPPITPPIAPLMGLDSTRQDKTRQDIKDKEKEPKGSQKKIGVKKPADVSETVWEDFLNHRKAKKAPVSETVINSIRKEAEKIPWEMDQALSEICARGWQGFKADWILRDKDGGKMSQNMKNLKDIYENGW